MVATNFLLLATMVAYVKATPVATAPGPSTTKWTGLSMKDIIDWEDIDKEAFKNPANWNNTSSQDAVTSASGDDIVTIMSVACEQGTCPDYSALFDLVYTFTAITSPGIPDPNDPGKIPPSLTIFEAKSDIRVEDCGQCQRQKIGSTMIDVVPGGCLDFTSCGRAQTICVDPGKRRAHRIWKDNGDKRCYGMKVERLGGCGFIKNRMVIHPSFVVASCLSCLPI
ncbi:uncharacterized protein BKA55DRAFT_530288 [Fusarium redolens]|uniref:Uncharacterized protein n=1 Tax=Fusarium redolens TaxID=48865 RepID=A0A9P9JPZ6_FUSRE|nr:uncharacterized protein BKA55DRAFT_530288 [Fusarium redolens]KAH7205807.1 hypothetical protein BKA55DRAFT_530288 [Fusarium redolens]